MQMDIEEDSYETGQPEYICRDFVCVCGDNRGNATVQRYLNL